MDNYDLCESLLKVESEADVEAALQGRLLRRRSCNLATVRWVRDESKPDK